MNTPVLLSSLVEYAVNHPEQAATAIGGLAAAAGHYGKTGRVPLGRLPFRAAQDAWGELADQWFGKSRPRGIPALVADISVDDLDTTLREQSHFEGADDQSYEYEGEVLNLRRPGGLRTHPDTGEAVPMELHVRAFQTEAGDLLLLPHDEASRSEAWGAHYRGRLLSWSRGRGEMASVLDDLGIDYDTIESERAAGITVVPPETTTSTPGISTTTAQ